MERPVRKEVQMWQEMERRAHEDEMQMLRELLEEKNASQATPSTDNHVQDTKEEVYPKFCVNTAER